MVVPLHKKGSLDVVNNFRGITLLSILGKLFTRILNNRLTGWAEEYSVYIKAQAGFRAAMSTVDNVLFYMGLSIIYLKKKRENFLCFRGFHEGI